MRTDRRLFSNLLRIGRTREAKSSIWRKKMLFLLVNEFGSSFNDVIVIGVFHLPLTTYLHTPMTPARAPATGRTMPCGKDETQRNV